MTNRRQFLYLLGLAALAPLPALAGLPASQVKSLRLLNLHTGERCNADFWVQGQWQTGELAQIDRLLRDHRADESTHMDPALLALLHRVQTRLGVQREIQVISGYRSPATNEALRRAGHQVSSRSLHMEGRAIDIRIPGVALRDLQKAALLEAGGGVGYYGNSNFVHLDTGRVRRWG